MGLFSSKEEKKLIKEEKKKQLIDKLSKPYIDNGFNASKQILLNENDLFMIDTNNKKWVFTNLDKFNKGIIKVYDFKDLTKYEAKNQNEKGMFASTHSTFGMLSTTSSIDCVYEISVFLNTNDIDDTFIKILNWRFAANSIMALNKNERDEEYESVVKCLEYIMNNK